MSIPVTETARLRLRPFVPEDMDDLAAMYAEPEVMRFIGDGPPLPATSPPSGSGQTYALWRPTWTTSHSFGHHGIDGQKGSDGAKGAAPMKKLDVLALLLVLVGALNWGLVAIARFDLVAALFGMDFGETSAITRVVYGLVGLSGVYVAARAAAIRGRMSARELITA